MIFDVNYQQFAFNEIPPPKRNNGILGLLYSLLFPVQWRHDINFGSYYTGSTDPLYSISTTYSPGDRVIYAINGGGSYNGNNAVYEALAIMPTNVQPTGTNVLPAVPPSTITTYAEYVNWLNTGNNGDPFYWQLIQPNFIGTNERQSYTCNKIILEWALNKWFGTTFRQPNANTWYSAPPIGSGKQASDIFIVTNQNYANELSAPEVSGGYNSPGSPQSSRGYSYGAPQAAQQIGMYDYTIYIPTAVYNALSSTSSLRTSIVQAFVNLYNLAANSYNIITY